MHWLNQLSILLDESIQSMIEDKTGLVFSAGVDSALVGHIAGRHTDLTAYTIGLEDAPDVKYSDRLRRESPFHIELIELSLEEIEASLPDVLKIADSSSPLDAGVGVPFYLVADKAKKDGLDVLLCGQGGDELFGGYWRYLEALVSKGPQAVMDRMQEDWVNAEKDNLARDKAMCLSKGTHLRFPYLYTPFSDYVRKMPFDLKIRPHAQDIICDKIGGHSYARKYALKKLALKEGVPEYIVNRVKKAAQYGSSVHKALDKLARSNGYKTKARQAGRRDYLKMYLEELAKGMD